MPFVLHQRYSRQQVHAELGGDLQSYLPHVDGAVVCGCFDPAFNARAPFEIDLGQGRDVIRYAERLHEQASGIPVFLRRGNLEWEYVGRFLATTLTRDKADLYPAKPYRRPDALAVLYLAEQAQNRPDSSIGHIENLPAYAIEGAAHLRAHLQRERSFTLAEAKRRSFRVEHGGLECQVCGLCESELPESLGEACFEVHHLHALAARAVPVVTRIDDLAIVCANCHRMLHRSDPMLSVAELSRLRDSDA